MPHVQIDSLKSRSWREVNEVLNATQRAVLSVFKVPLQDQCQEYAEHPQSQKVIKSKKSGIQYDHNALMFTVISTPCNEEIKWRFYIKLCRELKSNALINVGVVTLFVLTTLTSAENSATATSGSILEIGNNCHRPIA